MTTITQATVSIPVADLDDDGLLGGFAEGPRLVGSLCRSCGRTMIGARVVCSSCMSDDVDRIALPTTGTLYSFTTLHVNGEDNRTLGYVDLDDDVRTLADIRADDRPLTPDMRVVLATSGDEWFFEPTTADEEGDLR